MTDGEEESTEMHSPQREPACLSPSELLVPAPASQLPPQIPVPGSPPLSVEPGLRRFTFLPYSLESINERQREHDLAWGFRKSIRGKEVGAEVGFEWGPLLMAKQEVEGYSRQRARGDNTDQFDQNTGLQKHSVDSLQHLGMVSNSRLSLNFNL